MNTSAIVSIIILFAFIIAIVEIDPDIQTTTEGDILLFYTWKKSREWVFLYKKQ